MQLLPVAFDRHGLFLCVCVCPNPYSTPGTENFDRGEKGSGGCAECPNLCMPKQPRFHLHNARMSKCLLFVASLRLTCISKRACGRPVEW